MDKLFGEEKKDAAEEAGKVDEKGGGNEDDENHIEEELVDLPLEITALIGGDRVFESEEELEGVLAEAGVGDIHVVLVDGKPRLVMPSDQHNTFTSAYVADFMLKWGPNGWGFCSGTHKIHLSSGRSRDPDISYWGYPRCSKNPETKFLEPKNLEKGAIPDVVIQFSWKNKTSYEEDAIDDMMNLGLEEDCGHPSTVRPRLGYLVKARFSKKRKLPGAINKGSETQDLEGLDIYRLTHGSTIKDAHATSNPSAEYQRYVSGGPEIFITIAPQDLGISGVWALLYVANTGSRHLIYIKK